MGAVWIHSLADWLREVGIVVHEYPGWQTRSRSSGGFEGHPMGMVWHHDAAPERLSDQRRADLEYVELRHAPIGNLRVNSDGSWTVGAAGASNTAGKGGPWHDTTRGTVPLNDANRWTLNAEASNNGIDQPWPQVQTDSYVLGTAQLCRKLDWDPLRDLCDHQEWTEGIPKVRGPRKIDVGGGPSPFAPTGGKWDMDLARQAVVRKLAQLNGAVMLLDDFTHARQIDTRNGIGGDALGAGERRSIKINHPDVPADANGLFVNLTSANATGVGFLTVWPGGGDRPVVTHLSYDGGPADSQATYIVIQPDRFTNIYASTATDVIIDVLGYV